MIMYPLLSDPADRPHIEAVQRLVNAGWRFLHLRDERGNITAIYGERPTFGAVETITFRSANMAMAARMGREDYPHGGALWQTSGTVADAIGELLELPPHGHRLAPALARRASSSLWLPGDPL
jgi:hypothetical protein